jgi:hypothetical protein
MNTSQPSLIECFINFHHGKKMDSICWNITNHPNGYINKENNFIQWMKWPSWMKLHYINIIN